MDRMTPEQRHRCMSLICSKDTGPEWAVRRMVHAMGFRYRLDVSGLRASRTSSVAPPQDCLRARLFLACARLHVVSKGSGHP